MKNLNLLFFLFTFSFVISADPELEGNENDLFQIEEQSLQDQNPVQEIPSLPEEIYFEDERGLEIPDETDETFEESSYNPHSSEFQC